jgi:Xaa-Pro aminopeptidase
LVVIDIGAEYDYYTADVTRTIPINGKFSKEQKEIYQIVLDAQESAIKMLKPGVRFYQIDSTARSIVNDRLRKLGILKETDNERRFFKHGTSHWLGLDVHDVWKYHLSNHNFQNRVLEAGMVLTVEPGIYIEEGAEGVNPKYYNIGVRIEDDILITENGYELLSKLAPRTIEEIEKIMKK